MVVWSSCVCPLVPRMASSSGLVVLVPLVRGTKDNGNLIVRVTVVVPKKLKKREREILEAFAEEQNQDAREELFRKADS